MKWKRWLLSALILSITFALTSLLRWVMLGSDINSDARFIVLFLGCWLLGTVAGIALGLVVIW